MFEKKNEIIFIRTTAKKQCSENFSELSGV